mmetsp:Transcript_39414/g.73047  ORF Transcript_39414/g.73047 Transcript_39414/m.73047 type:complete len:247 (-) Transcript_39414:759-1499(-)
MVLVPLSCARSFKPASTKPGETRSTSMSTRVLHAAKLSASPSKTCVSTLLKCSSSSVNSLSFSSLSFSSLFRVWLTSAEFPASSISVLGGSSQLSTSVLSLCSSLTVCAVFPAPSSVFPEASSASNACLSLLLCAAFPTPSSVLPESPVSHMLLTTSVRSSTFCLSSALSSLSSATCQLKRALSSISCFAHHGGSSFSSCSCACSFRSAVLPTGSSEFPNVSPCQNWHLPSLCHWQSAPHQHGRRQ